MPNPKRTSFVRRNAGVTMAAGGGVTAIAIALLDHDYVTAVVAATTVVPAAVAFIVHHGGVRGLLHRFWRG
jgi:hypothetical protein